MVRSELKKLSKSQLKGHWKVPVLLTLIYSVVVLAISLGQNLSESLGFIFLFFLLALAVETLAVVGFPKFYLKFIKNNNDIKFKDFFASKKVALKSLGYVIFISIVGALFGAVIGFAIVSSVSIPICGPIIFTGTAWLGILVALAAIFLLIVFSMSVVLTPYILVDKECIKLFEAIKLSIKMMKGHKWELFVLYLSFIGWAILCVITLGIGYLWLAPYMSLTFTNFYKEIDKNYKVIED